MTSKSSKSSHRGKSMILPRISSVSEISDLVTPYARTEGKRFKNVSETVKESHLKYMLVHAPEIARVLNLEITKLPAQNTGKAEDQVVTMKDKSTQKIWYLFSLATVLSKAYYNETVGIKFSRFPDVIESARNNLRKIDPNFAPIVHENIVAMSNLHIENENKGYSKYSFSKRPFFLASKYGGVLLSVKPVARRSDGVATYKINLVSLGFYAYPNTPNRLKSIAKYGESNKENVMRMVKFSQNQTPRPEWKLQDASYKENVNSGKTPFFYYFLNTAMKPGGVAPTKPKVGTYNKIVRYPASAQQLVNQLYKLPNKNKQQLVNNFGNGARTVLARIMETNPNVGVHSAINKRYKKQSLVKKGVVTKLPIENENNLRLIMRGWAAQGEQAANKKKTSTYLKSYTHGNLIKVPGLGPLSKLSEEEIRKRVRSVPKPRFRPEPRFVGISKQRKPRKPGRRSAGVPTRYRNSNSLLYS